MAAAVDKSVASLKEAGNAAFSRKDYKTAEDLWDSHDTTYHHTALRTPDLLSHSACHTTIPLLPNHPSPHTGSYSQAIAMTPDDETLWSNKSAALLSLGQASTALVAAKRARKLKPEWPKAHGRVAAALLQLGQWEQAIDVYEEGLALDPDNEFLRQGLAAAAQRST
mmetsp:Transcript_40038/g.86640  ORF Transcript_40038/g.86640 Transcript_40038/m.86640 type:complete len:167 (-) Transcript_40038:54-554(-)